jgi:hypothetical protein
LKTTGLAAAGGGGINDASCGNSWRLYFGADIGNAQLYLLYRKS